MQRVVETMVILALLCALVAMAVGDLFSIPIVYESVNTRECVRVDDPAGRYSCTRMPRRFHHTWTE